jgi:hypothetical protein
MTKWGGRALLAGMDLTCGHGSEASGLGVRASRRRLLSLGLELEVVARPLAGVRGVWVREGVGGAGDLRGARSSLYRKRWVVEGTFAWLGRTGVLRQGSEENPRASVGLAIWACYDCW